MITHENLIESIAKAIHSQKYTGSQHWDSIPDFVRQTYREYAKAAIPVVYNVMRDPSNEMIDAANRARPSVTSRTIQAAVDASPLNPNTKP
ncbi:hypothetical protein HB779_01075 (plasmid) [Phyllobacterium sp. 628]|uniref:hypothetical protein n=1 Tax=Phyllobacterium sp. 628 TaxID=2718938 RepID=UPI0016628B8E|nr:hypothetical protein [Phyllobacterium sp. 628]QND50603.1 hypothetical protein HB779_01075 [Phyllobacterium sp. 628]